MGMSGPAIASAWQPTGRTSFRVGWLGGLILIVEESRRTGQANGQGDGDYTGNQRRWRDARVADFAPSALDILLSPGAVMAEKAHTMVWKYTLAVIGAITLALASAILAGAVSHSLGLSFDPDNAFRFFSGVAIGLLVARITLGGGK